jgi:hypothetical protein
MYKNKIAVITPTIRPEGLKLIQKALNKQNLSDFDWWICSPQKPPKSIWGNWLKDDFQGGYWTLNRAYNRLIKESTGEIIVSWQDFTYANKSTLSCFNTFHKKHPKALLSILGDKYLDEDFSFATWTDPRVKSEAPKETPFTEVEWNLCSCPRSALYEIGGFDEAMDILGYGMDGYGVNERLNELKYKFYTTSKVRSYSLMHGRVKDWEEHNLIHGQYQKHIESLKKQNKYPFLEYLSR